MAVYSTHEVSPSLPDAAPQDPSENPPPRTKLPSSGALLIGALVGLRLAYHASYLEVNAFALGTFSDGRIYETAARDLLAHPPLGTQPFYLQGLYAYFMAACMAIRPDVSMALLGQLVLSGLTLWLFFRVTRAALGVSAAVLSTAVLMLCPALMFYENKFLSAELGIAANVLVLWAFGRYKNLPTPGAAGLIGLTVALSVLARPNMLLALPFCAVALWLVVGRKSRVWPAHVGAMGLGFVLGVAPMAARNLVVTGQATFMPAHGGGTSFYIGNNPHANGVWNTAGGLLTPDVVHEREQLASALQVDDSARAVGAELYRRSFVYMRESPADFGALQLRKLWLMVGNDELAQDYDWHGEAEMLPWARWFSLPFGVVLALGLLGLWRLRRVTELIPWLWVLGGQLVAVVAANVVFFTSAQHRLPLAVPLAWVSGLAIMDLWEHRRRRARAGLTGLLLVAMASWPRTSKQGPSAVHYFNLAAVQADAGELTGALANISRAAAARPDHPLIRLEYARILWKTGHFDEAENELDWLEVLANPPPQVPTQVRLIREAVRVDRAEALE